MLAYNSAIISSLSDYELGIFCDTILMYSGLSPVIIISICFTEKDMRFCLIYELYQICHYCKQSCICQQIFVHYAEANLEGVWHNQARMQDLINM
jgi:hypothetical protein